MYPHVNDDMVVLFPRDVTWYYCCSYDYHLFIFLVNLSSYVIFHRLYLHA